MKNETARREIESLDYYLQNRTDDYSEESHTAMMMAIKALEQQPCEDCISREQAKQFLYYEIERLHDDGLYDCFSKIIDDMYNELSSVTPRMNLAETSQDCISREAVQDLISRWLSDYLLDETREALETINYKIGDMPPVIPQRKVGKWTRVPIRNEKGGCIGAKMICSECDNDNKHDEYMKFCPNCGSYNAEIKESADD